MRVLTPAAIACCLLISFTSCSGLTVFGYDLGDYSELENYVTNYVDQLTVQMEVMMKSFTDMNAKITTDISIPTEKIADDFSAGSGDSVCAPGDAICEKEAATPKSANEQGRPR